MTKEKSFTAAQPIKLEFLLSEEVPADVKGYTLVLKKDIFP